MRLRSWLLSPLFVPSYPTQDNSPSLQRWTHPFLSVLQSTPWRKKIKTDTNCHTGHMRNKTALWAALQCTVQSRLDVKPGFVVHFSLSHNQGLKLTPTNSPNAGENPLWVGGKACQHTCQFGLWLVVDPHFRNEKYLIPAGNRIKGFKQHEGEQVNGVNCMFMFILQKHFVVLHDNRL